MTDRLLETESRFQRLYEANLMGICYPDRFGAFSDGNDEFLRVVGYTRADLKAGLVRWDTMTPPECAELDASLRRCTGSMGANRHCLLRVGTRPAN